MGSESGFNCRASRFAPLITQEPGRSTPCTTPVCISAASAQHARVCFFVIRREVAVLFSKFVFCSESKRRHRPDLGAYLFMKVLKVFFFFFFFVCFSFQFDLSFLQVDKYSFCSCPSRGQKHCLICARADKI